MHDYINGHSVRMNNLILRANIQLENVAQYSRLWIFLRYYKLGPKKRLQFTAKLKQYFQDIKTSRL